MAATNEAEKKERSEGEDDEKRTMGRKHIVPYGFVEDDNVARPQGRGQHLFDPGFRRGRLRRGSARH